MANPPGKALLKQIFDPSITFTSGGPSFAVSGRRSVRFGATSPTTIGAVTGSNLDVNDRLTVYFDTPLYTITTSSTLQTQPVGFQYQPKQGETISFQWNGTSFVEVARATVTSGSAPFDGFYARGSLLSNLPSEMDLRGPYVVTYDGWVANFAWTASATVSNQTILTRYGANVYYRTVTSGTTTGTTPPTHTTGSVSDGLIVWTWLGASAGLEEVASQLTANVATTTDATPTNLIDTTAGLVGPALPVTANATCNTAMALTVNVMGVTPSGLTNLKHIVFTGTLVVAAGVPSFLSVPMKTIITEAGSASAWDATIQASGSSFSVTVIGQSSTTIKWTARVSTARIDL